MAEGRMLKNKISRDGRVADLPTDTDRLLFTWGIAHLDIGGKISGDPREYKAAVAPTLEHVTPLLITEFFEVAEAKGLINRYQANGRWIIKFLGFEKNQSLRKDKERPSEFPDPTPGELRDYYGTTPAEDKIKEEKLREVKAAKAPVDNSPTDDQKHRLDDLCVKTIQKYKTKHWNPYQWIQTHLKANPEALIHTLQSLIDNEAASPWAYCEKILSIENGNYNEAEFQAKASKDKNIFLELADDLKKIHRRD